MSKKIGVIVCVLALVVGTLGAKPKKNTVKTEIRSWQLSAPAYLADTTRIDTSYLNLPMQDPLNNYSISNVWAGSLISPVESRIYFSRLNTIEDIFGRQYQPFVITPKDVTFYRTNLPYSTISYMKGFTTYHEENELDFLFTGNLTRRLNLGLKAAYHNAAGHYQSQENKLFNGAIFGSFNGNHYSLQAAFTFATMSNFENGGIQTLEDLKGTLEPEDIPIRMIGMSSYRYLSGLLNHYYSITVEREHHDSIEVTNNFGEKEKRDTVKIEYIPVITFAHTFDLNNSTRRYIENDGSQDYFANIYRNWSETRDSTDVLTIRNTLSVTFEEEFNKLLRFGATVYATNECQRYAYPVGTNYTELPLIGNSSDTIMAHPLVFQTLDSYHYQWMNNTFVGGSIYKNKGTYIRYSVNGDVCLLGYKLGEFQVNGHVASDIPLGKDTMSIAADVFFRNETPTYYQQHYYSNHFRWDNDFSKPMRFYAGGHVAYPTQWVKPKVKVGFENVTNPLWSDAKDGLIKQYDGNVQIISVDGRVDLTTPWINLENNVVWQHSTSDILALPAITLYHNLYYHGTWFKALDAQIGVDLRYHTSYYAPILNPATGQFCAQTEYKIGNYPIMNVYINFHVRSLHLKFFAHYTHLNHLFMRKNTDCQIMPFYPYTPDVFRAGLAWSFFK